jgi:lysylphosphatidylglycerol synthetase-like protein (DUF2156 family)
MASLPSSGVAIDHRLRLVRQHSYNGLALLTLYDGWRYFEYPGIDGFVAYELHRRVAVACGDPVCAEPDLRALLTRFAEYCISCASEIRTPNTSCPGGRTSS